MSTSLSLSWLDGDGPLAWRPGHALRLPLRLANASSAARTLARLEEPSAHLVFELTAVDGRVTSATGRDWMRLAGDPSHEGVAIPDALAPGAAWDATHALDAWMEPPPRGRYTLRARYLAPGDEVAEAPPRAVDVTAADHVAASSASLSSSAEYLAHALATPEAVSLRVASSASPQGAVFAFEAARWPGVGRVAVAQHAFSPTVDPPLPAFRWWVVWQGDGRLGGARVDHQGRVEARFEVPLAFDAGTAMLEPVQYEDGSMRVPLLEGGAASPRVVWVHVDPQGACAVAGAQALLPGASRVRVSAFPNGVVVVLWVDASGRALLGSPARTTSTLDPPSQLARLDEGEVLWFDAVDGRRGVTALVVSSELVARAQRLRAWMTSPTGLASLGECAWHGAPSSSVRAVALPLGGAALSLRGDDGSLHVARAEGGGWSRVASARCGLEHGLAANAYGPVAWGVDPVEGLRFETGPSL